MLKNLLPVVGFVVLIACLLSTYIITTPTKPQCPEGAKAQYRRGWVCTVPALP